MNKFDKPTDNSHCGQGAWILSIRVMTQQGMRGCKTSSLFLKKDTFLFIFIIVNKRDIFIFMFFSVFKMSEVKKKV